MKIILSLLALNLTLFANITLPKNFKTDFHQSITNEKGKVINYKGIVLFKNIEQLFTNDIGEESMHSRSIFKWSYTSPTKKEVCTDGTQLIVIDHDLEQVSSYMIDDGINLEEILRVAKKFSVKEYKARYKELEYLISVDEKRQLEQIVYVDNLDNTVKIIFMNMNYNISINDDLLECNTPPEYDVIKG